MKSYSHILRAVCSTPWAIQPEKLHAIMAFLELKASGGFPNLDVLASIRAQNVEAAARAQATGTVGAVALLPLYGLISHRASMMDDISGPGGTSTERFAQAFRAAMADASVSTIVIDVDSPGGSVEGVPELADEIYQARGKKTLIAVSNSLMASAAYWIACGCSEIVVSPSSLTGSIGVYSAHDDISKALEMLGEKITLVSYGKFKTEGNPYQPLDPDAEAAMQDMVNQYGVKFTRFVAKGRGAKVEDVRNGFGQGRVLTAEDAVKAGMADRIDTLDGVLGRYGVSRSSGARAEASPEVEAEKSTAVTDVLNGTSVTPQAAVPAKTATSDCTCGCDACAAGDHGEACNAEVCPTSEACGHEAADAKHARSRKRSSEALRREIELLSV